LEFLNRLRVEVCLKKNVENLILSMEDDMKKLLVLALVLGMATMASATPTIWFGTSSTSSTAIATTMTPAANSNFRLYVWASSDVPVVQTYNSDDDVMVTVGGGIDGLQFTAAFNSTKISAYSTTLSSSISTPATGVLQLGTALGAAFDADGSNSLLKFGYATGPGVWQDVFASAYLGSIRFLEGATVQATDITLYQGANETIQTFIEEANADGTPGSRIQANETIHINGVPEPMTMALLGLGGLFLRRRSK
jgi:hypothetical protein